MEMEMEMEMHGPSQIPPMALADINVVIKKPSRKFSSIFRSHEFNDSTNGKSEPPQDETLLRVRELSSDHAGEAKEADTSPPPEALGHDASNKIISNINLDIQPSPNAAFTRCLNRGVILTGGTSGIGLALTKRLVLESAGRVVLITRNPTKAASTISQIKQETSLPDAPISYFEADLTNPSFPTTIASLFANFPYCNTLINCAGISQSTPILKSTPAQDQEILQTNLLAPITLSKLFLTHYLSSVRKRNAIPIPNRSEGHEQNATQSYTLLNISSLLALHPTPGTATYSASKAALIAHTRALTLEGARYQSNGRVPFRANVIVPGYISTPMTEAFSEGYRRELQGKIPLGRFGTAEEVADAGVWAVGNEYANGCVLTLDGGMGVGGG